MRPCLRTISTLFVALVLTGAVPPVSGRRVSLKVDPKAIQAQGAISRAVARTDSVLRLCGDSAVGAVRLYGYDKPFSATKESVFISSRLSADTIDSVRVRVEYRTMKGEGLHTRHLTLPCQVAPGASERILFPTWDATHTFYYHRTPPARKQGLTPYDVLLTPDTVYCH